MNQLLLLLLLLLSIYLNWSADAIIWH